MLDIGNISPKKNLINQLLYMPAIGDCVQIQTSPWWTDVTLDVTLIDSEYSRLYSLPSLPAVPPLLIALA